MGSILQGHALDVLQELPAESVHCVVTSPPYWGLRDYGLPDVEWPSVSFAPMPGLDPIDVPEWTGNLGLEPDFWGYVGHLVAIFREVRRVLRGDGTLWLNLGDSYAGTGYGIGIGSPAKHGNVAAHEKPQTSTPVGLKPKDLCGVPWRVAFALQADGWWLRSDNIWHKPNPMPESVTDRTTRAHESMFMLAKSARYFYDADAVREPHKQASLARYEYGLRSSPANAPPGSLRDRMQAGVGRSDRMGDFISPLGRNLRDVWTIATQPYSGAHYAVFPEALVDPCIKAGCPVSGIVLDPFAGSGTTGKVAYRLGRRFIGIDLAGGDVDLGGHTPNERVQASARGQSLEEYQAGQLVIWGDP